MKKYILDRIIYNMRDLSKKLGLNRIISAYFLNFFIDAKHSVIILKTADNKKYMYNIILRILYV